MADSWTPFLAANDPISVCVCKLKRLKAKLKEWSIGTFGNIFLELEQHQHDLKMLQQSDLHNINEEEYARRERELIEAINRILKNQNSLLMQKNRAH